MREQSRDTDKKFKDGRVIGRSVRSTTASVLQIPTTTTTTTPPIIPNRREMREVP